MFLLYLVFSIFKVYFIVVLVLYESYPIKLLKNKQKNRTPTFTSTLGTIKYSLKPEEAVALQITGSLSDNKVSVFTNKSTLH